MTNSLPLEHYIEQQLSLREHRYVNWGNLIKSLRHEPVFEGAYLGNYSLTTRKKDLTLISEFHTWCRKPASASAVARLVLRAGLDRLGRRRILWSRRSYPLLEIPQPLYCQPVSFAGRLTYVDISRCYFDLYSRLPFDIRFQGLRAFGGEFFFKDFLPRNIVEYKLCRNSLVGCMRSTTSARIKEGKQVVGPNYNPYLSPEHWGFMAHLLHTLAHQAVEYGACYYNTDGAIFTNDADATRWMQYVVDMGFTPHIKAQGSGSVWSVGNYQVGLEKGGRVNANASEFSNLISVSPYVGKRWLEWV